VTSFVLFGIGWIMYGAASTRAGVIPRSISITIIVAGLMSGVPIGIVYLPGGVVHGLAFVWLGAWMLRAATVARASGGERRSLRRRRLDNPVRRVAHGEPTEERSEEYGT
jgi:hypothetical protein